MTFSVLTAVTKANTAKGGNVRFPYKQGETSLNYKAGQTVTLTVYDRDFAGLVTTFNATGGVDVTWPADAPYVLPPGEYNVQFEQITQNREDWAKEIQPIAFQAHSTATDVAGAVADFNALLDKLQASKLMKSA